MDRSTPSSRDETSRPWEILVALDRTEATPLRHQLERRLRGLIVDGLLAPATRLPSTRQLAAELEVSRGVVVDAFDQLAAQGMLSVRRGSAPRVAQLPTQRRAYEPPRSAPFASDVARLDLRATTPDLSLFPRRQWARHERAALSTIPDAALDYGDPRGLLALREAIIARCNRARGTSASVDDTLIVSGFSQAVTLVGAVLAAGGARRVAVEDPSWPEGRAMLGAAGLELVGVPVDAHGVVVDALERVDVQAVLVTPAHQFPTGVVLSSERRLALLRWAERHEALIIEDDYDAELRYDRRPVGALHGLAPHRVLHVGTVSKTLAPGLRLGWMLAPPGLVDQLAQARFRADGGPAVLGQLALAGLLNSGDFDRHLARARLEYRRRRDALVTALADALPSGRITGAAAGLHVVVELRTQVDDARVAALAERRGVLLRGLSELRLEIGTGPPGLVCGYGRLRPTQARAAAAEIVRAVQTAHDETTASTLITADQAMAQVFMQRACET